MVMLCVFLCAACYFDYRHSRIPNWLTALSLSAGGMLAFWGGGILTLSEFLFRSVLAAAFFYPLFRIGTLGAGDVKLFGVCAGYLPDGKVLCFLFFALLFAAIHSLIRFVREPDPKERFCYLFSYIRQVAESGRWTLYFADKQEQKKAGVCLAGPILLSVLLYLGGMY